MLQLPINRFDVADYLGTTRETVAPAFAKLETDHLIRRITPHTVHILNLRGLQALASGTRTGKLRKRSQ